MGLIKTGIQMAGGYAMLKTAVGAVEKHDQNKAHSQQQQQPPPQYQQPQQFIAQQQSSRNDGQTYGKYIAPDGTEYPVYQPQPQFQGTFQPVQPQFQSQTSRSIGYEVYQPQYEQRSVSQGSPSPVKQGHQGQQGSYQAPASSTPHPYQYDQKS